MTFPNQQHLLAKLGLFVALAGTQLVAQPITSGLALHLESDAGVTLDLNGKVQSWTDQAAGTNGDNSATQMTSGARPDYVLGAFAGNPTLPALRFDGNSSFLDLAGQVLTSQQFTIFAVASDTGGDGHREIFSNWSFANSYTSVFFGTTGVTSRGFRLSDHAIGGQLENPAQPQILTGVNGSIDALVYTGNNLEFTTASLPTRDLSTAYFVGVQGTFGFEYWQGDIAALLVYDRELTPTEINATWSYLDAKYVAAIPEPSSGAALVGLGVLCLVATRRRRN